MRVEWANGTTNSYRMGKEGKYDLTLASPPSPVVSDTDSDEVSESGIKTCFYILFIFLYKTYLPRCTIHKRQPIDCFIKRIMYKFLASGNS